MSPLLLTNSDTIYVPSRTTYPPFSSYLKNPVSVAPIWLNTRFSEFPLKLVSQQDHHHFWCAILHCVLLQSLWRLRNNLVFIICIPDAARTHDPQLRRLLLYPTELRRHFIIFFKELFTFTNITKIFETSKYFSNFFVFFF